MRIKNYLFILLLLCFIKNLNSYSEIREVPNIIIKENPKKEVYQIETLKRRTKPAELNLTFTKIKTEEIPVKVDKSRNIIFVDLKDINEKNIYVLEDLKNIPNSKTIEGRRALNNLKNKKQNFSVTRYDLKFKEKKTKLEIKYKIFPQNLFLVVVDKNNIKEKKIYKAKFINYSSPRGNNVSIKLWLFGEEMGGLTNVVINPNNNTTGDIEIRQNGEYNYPENAIKKSNLRTVFDMIGSPVEFEFEESDTLELIDIGGNGSTSIRGIKNNQGNFYKNRNEYAECKIPGYNLKARIWGDSNKIEFSLNKISSEDGYVKFRILHKSENGDIRQNIVVEMFLNNKKFNEYFPKLYAEARPEFLHSFDLNYNPYLKNEEKIEVKNFITDSLMLKKYSKCNVEQYWAEESGKVEVHKNISIDIEKTSIGLDDDNNKISGIVSNFKAYIPIEWIKPLYNTTQYFDFHKYYFEYGNKKRKIDFTVSFAITDNVQKFIETMEGTISGLPFISSNNFLDKVLVNNQKNGKDTVTYFNNVNTVKFMVAKKRNSSFYYLVNDSISYNDIKDPPKILDIKFKSEYVETGPTGFMYYYLYVDKFRLRKIDRKIKIIGINDEIYEFENKITIPKFSVESLVDKSTTSIEKSIVKYIDVSDKFFDSLKEYSINLGTVYFKSYDDIGVLQSNSSKSPIIELPKKVYLEDEIGNKINVNLSFDLKDIVTSLEMKNYYTSKSAGGNGAIIYLILSREEYKKLLQNGGDKVYTLKNGDINISINLDKNPLGVGSGDGILKSTLVSQIKIITNKVFPSIATIIFNKNTPLLKNNFFSALNNNINYLKQPFDDYNYNNTLTLLGIVSQYNYTARKHNYELIDDKGNLIKGFILSNGNGGYWEKLDIGDGNTITLSQGKDTKTYIALTKWNYERSRGSISIKHYIQSSPQTNQYFKFYFELPDFDPSIYYNENYNLSTIKLNKEIVKNINSSTGNTLELGYIALNDYDMGITIQNNGPKKDTEGLRIEKQIFDLDLIDLDTNMPTGKKATIKLVDESNNEIIEGKIIGRNKRAKVILELPSTLSKTNSYIIKSKETSGVFDSNRNDYILKIGRNGYWKEIIKSIKILGNKKLEGSATIKFSNMYEEKSKILFSSISYDNLDTVKLKEPIPIGVSLENSSGYGLLKGEKNDRAYINYNGIKTEIGVLSSLGDTSQKSIKLTNGNIIEVQFKNGELNLSLNERKLGAQSNESINIILERNGGEIVNFALTLVIEKSWLKIINKEVLDFGDVLVGNKVLDAKASIVLETSDSINKNNIKVLLPNKKIQMSPIGNSNIKDLEAEIIYYELKKQLTNNQYRIDVEGKLDIKNISIFGEHKGVAEFIIEVKE